MDGGKGYRVEVNSVGAKDVPENVYYGVQSMRAAENFQTTGLDMYPEIINNLVYVKKAVAIINCEIGLLERKTAEAIVQTRDETLEDRFREDFIVDPAQGGVGTFLNMSTSEVIANRAVEILGGQRGDHFIVSSNDHVSCEQSINDVTPTADKMTSLRLPKNLRSELMRLHEEFSHRTEEFDHAIKMGHIRVQDVVFIRLGQELKTYSAAVMRDIRRMNKAMEEMYTLNMDDTTIGTGINADEAYLRRTVLNLAKVLNMELVQALDLTDATQNLDPFVAASGAIKACAVTLSEIANDLRLMSSGSEADFNEVNFPVRQNGSSIISDKVNPVILEVVSQVAFNIVGSDLAITMAAEAGQLELSTFGPIIFYYVSQSIDTLAYAVGTLVDSYVPGITVNEERCRSLVENSIGVIMALSPHVGHGKTVDISKRVLQTGVSVRSAILQEGPLGEEELDHILDPIRMTEPGISGKELLMKNNINEK